MCLNVTGIIARIRQHSKFRAQKPKEPWIFYVYYWFLFYIWGAYDADENPATIQDRYPITEQLRHQKERLGLPWYLLVGLTFWGSYEWLCHMNYHYSWWLTLLSIVSIPWFILITWLVIHVLWVYKPPTSGTQPEENNNDDIT